MKVFGFLLIIIFFLIGCTDSEGILFKNYAYKPIVKKYKKLELFIHLIGKDKKVNSKLSVRGKESYDLLIWFSSPKKLQRDIIIKSIELYDISLKKTVLVDKEIIQKFKIADGDVYDANFFFYKLKIPYNGYSIRIKFHLSNSNKIYEFESKFIKDYKEEVITFWDQLMGI